MPVRLSVRWSLRLSVRLWRLCTVVTGCDGSRISLHAWIDGCLYYLLTMPDPDLRMGWCRDFWWKWGYGKSGNCSNITYFTYFFYWWTVTTWHICLHERVGPCTNDTEIVFGIKCIMSEDGTTNYHIGLKQRHIVRILPTYKTCNRICVTDVHKVSNRKVRTAYRVTA